MIRRVLALFVLIWALGFALFVIALPQPAPERDTDAIVVLTGGPGRIERGLTILQARRAKRMLISGVNRSVRPHELAIAQHVPRELFDCCIDLGREAVDTRSNAMETARWIAARRYHTVRLITTDWHMRRARHELDRALDPGTEIVVDAVKSRAGFYVLFKEYHKYLLSLIGPLVGL